jgi:hypothetical protein
VDEKIEEMRDGRGRRGIKVQIGDEEMTHARILAVKCRRPVLTAHLR